MDRYKMKKYLKYLTLTMSVCAFIGFLFAGYAAIRKDLTPTYMYNALADEVKQTKEEIRQKEETIKKEVEEKKKEFDIKFKYIDIMELTKGIIQMEEEVKKNPGNKTAIKVLQELKEQKEEAKEELKELKKK